MAKPLMAKPLMLACLKQHTDFVTLAIRAKVNARRDGPIGYYGTDMGALVWSVCSPAVENKANEELERSIASYFQLSPSAVTLIRGQTARSKVFRLNGITSQRIEELLAASGIPSTPGVG
ncbi:MAG: DUF167 domain-containing protein [Bdellovibrionota bacterium]